MVISLIQCHYFNFAGLYAVGKISQAVEHFTMRDAELRNVDVYIAILARECSML